MFPSSQKLEPAFPDPRSSSPLGGEQPNPSGLRRFTTGGLFITFEGGEGTGKSTQVRRLAARLRQAGLEVLTTREPGGSPRAEAIRTLLLSGRAKPFGVFAETVLFAAARADHVETSIRPALEAGAAVLCDRFVDSTRVYQGEVSGVGRMAVTALEQAATQGLAPDLTLLLDAPPGTGLARARGRRAPGAAADRFEGEGESYHERVRAAFLAIAHQEPERCIVIDADAGPDEVEAAVWQAVQPRLAAGGIRV